jgi:hypothetical protein
MATTAKLVSRNLAYRLTRCAALDRLSLLMLGELRFAPDLHAARFGAFAPLAFMGADQLALDFGKAAAHGHPCIQPPKGPIFRAILLVSRQRNVCGLVRFSPQNLTKLPLASHGPIRTSPVSLKSLIFAKLQMPLRFRKTLTAISHMATMRFGNSPPMARS